MAFLLLGISGCSLHVPLPSESLNELAEGVCLVGHPTATYKGAKIVKASPRIFGDRFLDIDIVYSGMLSGDSHTLSVRFNVDSFSPCTVRTTVLGDDGMVWPLLLDNSVASPIIGTYVCESLSGDK